MLFMRDVFPFLVSFICMSGVSIMLHAATKMTHDMGDCIWIVVLSFINGEVWRNIIEEVFYDGGYALEERGNIVAF